MMMLMYMGLTSAIISPVMQFVRYFWGFSSLLAPSPKHDQANLQRCSTDRQRASWKLPRCAEELGRVATRIRELFLHRQPARAHGPQDPKLFAEKTRDLARIYLAVGIDPQVSTDLRSVGRAEHAELTWVLNCVARMSELERMTQYKDKARKQQENVSVGLFDYPI